MASIPKALIFLRLLIGIVILALSFSAYPYYNVVAVVLFSIGLLSDILDGIVARKLNVSTISLRRLDSTVDQIFFVLVAAATFVRSPQFFYTNKVQLIMLLSFEAATYLICFIKFRKEIATHAIASKVWTLSLFATMVELIVWGNSTVLFQVCFYLGIITRLEIIAIILILRQWTNDVPGIYQAVMLRQGKPIKRNKLFNG